MRTGILVEVTAAERDRLEAIVADRNSPQKHVWRAGIVLATADGLGTVAIMRHTAKSKTVVWRWQERFAQEGVDGLLRDKTRPSRVKPFGPEVAERIVALTLAEPPGETTHWTGRAMAKVTGVSLSYVQRVWRSHGLQPHRIRTFKLSNDPKFAAKVRDIVGLYVDPPAHAVVLSVDEKSQIQAPGPHPAGPAPEEGSGRDHDPRLQAQRHDHPIRRLRRAGGQGHRPLHAAPPASGVHPVSERRRARGPGRQDGPRHPRQLPHSPQGDRMAGASSALELPFHAHLGQLAQRR